MSRSLLALTVVTSMMSSFTHADRFYVDASAPGGGDGASWSTAFRSLQDALDETVSDRGDELWIAAGIYRPDDGVSVTPGARTATFTLKDGVVLYGGFAGGEDDLNQRNWSDNVTILSGEIGATRYQWSNRVVTLVGDAVLDGLTVIKGFANIEYGGGGVYAPESQITVRNSVFRENGGVCGGAIHGAAIHVSHSSFENNSADVGGAICGQVIMVEHSSFLHNGAAEGGAIYGDPESTIDVAESVFESNTSGWGGGAISASRGATITISSSSFLNNRAEEGRGGAVFAYSSESSVVAIDSSFTGNEADGNVLDLGGGAIGGHSVSVLNCVFRNNRSTSGGALGGNILEIANSLFDGNSAVLGGGAIHAEQITAVRSIFSDNNATNDYGGAVLSGQTWAINCLFSGNSAKEGGGAISGGRVTVTNCTFHGNSAHQGGAVWGNLQNSILNSIFWGNLARDQGLASGQGSEIYALNHLSNTADGVPGRAPNLIQGGLSGIHIATADGGGGGAPDLGDAEDWLLDSDPLFADADIPAGADGVWGTADDGLRLEAASPAINAGNNAFLPDDALDVDGDGDMAEPLPIDLASLPRVKNGTVDLGAYEVRLIEFELELTAQPADWGDAWQSGDGIYPSGAEVEVVATPHPGYLFDSWDGIDGSENPLILLMDGPKSITAVFVTDFNDNDSDGLTNYEEIVTWGSDPNNPDTSGDGILDREAVMAGFTPLTDFSSLVALVTADPERFEIETCDVEAVRLEGVLSVLNDPGAYDLHTEDSIQDLNLGGLILRRSQAGLDLEFTLEESVDLAAWEVRERIQREIAMTEGKLFLRVRAGLPRVPRDVRIFDHPILGEILTDAEGRTLYYFEFDIAGENPTVNSPSWPLVTVAGAPQAELGITANISVSAFGEPNGSFLTIEHYPVYHYLDDSEPGEANGHGAGSVWWTIRPNGSINR